MAFSSIIIQGNIISSEIINKIRNDDEKFQTSGDFALDRKTAVRDEIGVAWRSEEHTIWHSRSVLRDSIKPTVEPVKPGTHG